MMMMMIAILGDDVAPVVPVDHAPCYGDLALVELDVAVE